MLKTRLTKVIDVDDWDALVSETYGRPYSFQQQDGCKSRQNVRLTVPVPAPYLSDYENDTIPEVVNHNDMGVSFKAWLARNPEQRLEGEDDLDSWGLGLWWERNFYPDVSMVINDLHTKGLLEAGEYEICIDW